MPSWLKIEMFKYFWYCSDFDSCITTHAALQRLSKLSPTLSVSLSYILHVCKPPVSGDIFYIFFVTIIFHRIYFFLSFTFIVSARYLGTHDLFITFNNIPALRVSDYIEQVKFLRGLACYCTFWRYTVLTSSETWSKHNFSVFLRKKISFLPNSLQDRLPSCGSWQPVGPLGHLPAGLGLCALFLASPEWATGITQARSYSKDRGQFRTHFSLSAITLLYLAQKIILTVFAISALHVKSLCKHVLSNIFRSVFLRNYVDRCVAKKGNPHDFIIIFNLANAELLCTEKWCYGKGVIVIMCVGVSTTVCIFSINTPFSDPCFTTVLSFI